MADGYPYAPMGGFATWTCVFTTVERGREIHRERRVNVASGQMPPKEMQSDGNIYKFSDIINGVAYYDASHVVIGLSVDECEARRVARRLIGPPEGQPWRRRS